MTIVSSLRSGGWDHDDPEAGLHSGRGAADSEGDGPAVWGLPPAGPAQALWADWGWAGVGGRRGGVGGLLRVLGKFVGRFCPVEACVSYRTHRWMSSVYQALCLDHLPSRGSEGSGGVRGPQGTRPVALLARWCEWSVTSAAMEGSRNKRAKNFHWVSQLQCHR